MSKLFFKNRLKEVVKICVPPKKRLREYAEASSHESMSPVALDTSDKEDRPGEVRTFRASLQEDGGLVVDNENGSLLCTLNILPLSLGPLPSSHPSCDFSSPTVPNVIEEEPLDLSLQRKEREDTEPLLPASKALPLKHVVETSTNCNFLPVDITRSFHIDGEVKNTPSTEKFRDVNIDFQAKNFGFQSSHDEAEIQGFSEFFLRNEKSYSRISQSVLCLEAKKKPSELVNSFGNEINNNVKTTGNFLKGKPINECDQCGKKYKYAKRLYKHKQAVHIVRKENVEVISTEEESSKKGKIVLKFTNVKSKGFIVSTVADSIETCNESKEVVGDVIEMDEDCVVVDEMVSDKRMELLIKTEPGEIFPDEDNIGMDNVKFKEQILKNEIVVKEEHFMNPRLRDTSIQALKKCNEDGKPPIFWNFLVALLRGRGKKCCRAVKWIDQRDFIFCILSPDLVTSMWRRLKGDPELDWRDIMRILYYYSSKGIVAATGEDYHFQLLAVPPSLKKELLKLKSGPFKRPVLTTRRNLFKKKTDDNYHYY